MSFLLSISIVNSMQLVYLLPITVVLIANNLLKADIAENCLIFFLLNLV